jgi:hypothetical protein
MYVKRENAKREQKTGVISETGKIIQRIIATTAVDVTNKRYEKGSKFCSLFK